MGPRLRPHTLESKGRSALKTGRSWLREQFKGLRKHSGGVAAFEFAIIAPALIWVILNVVDGAFYAFDRIQVQNAAEMGAEAALKTCDLNHVPATTQCSGLSQAIKAAIQSTSLGTQITLQSGSPSEGYYCVNASNQLKYVSDVSSKPADCSAVGMPSGVPADYISVQTSFAYSPLIPAISIVSLLTTPITSTAWMRLG